MGKRDIQFIRIGILTLLFLGYSGVVWAEITVSEIIKMVVLLVMFVSVGGSILLGSLSGLVFWSMAKDFNRCFSMRKAIVGGYVVPFLSTLVAGVGSLGLGLLGVLLTILTIQLGYIGVIWAGSHRRESLVTTLNDEHAQVRVDAVRGLGSLHSVRVLAPILTVFKDPDDGVRKEAVGALGQMRDARVLIPLLQALHDPSAECIFMRGIA